MLAFELLLRKLGEINSVPHDLGYEELISAYAEDITISVSEVVQLHKVCVVTKQYDARGKSKS